MKVPRERVLFLPGSRRQYGRAFVPEKSLTAMDVPSIFRVSFESALYALIMTFAKLVSRPGPRHLLVGSIHLARKKLRYDVFDVVGKY